MDRTAATVEYARSSGAIESRQPAARIVGFDVARSLAIWGMVTVHVSLVMSGKNWRPGWLAEIVDFLDGRAAALFVILAGVGLSLRTGRTRAARDAAALNAERRVLRRRGVFLLVAGFCNLVIWQGDILRVYGVSIFLAAWFIDAPRRRLLTTAAGFVVGFVVSALVFDYGRNWDFATMTYHRLWTPAGLTRNLMFDGFRSVFPWTGLLFFGMWLGRLDVRQPRVQRRMLWIGAIVTIGVELASFALVRGFSARLPTADRADVVAIFGTLSMPPFPIFFIAAGGAAVAVIGGSLLLSERYADSRPIRSLAATGQMAFTWYVAHIVVGLGGLILLGLYDTQPLTAAAPTALAMFLFAVVVSTLWRGGGRLGPMEWLMRRMAG